MSQVESNSSRGVTVIDGDGYYVEQFLCRQTVMNDAGLASREEILDKIFLAVNIVESVAPKGLDSTVVDISTDASGLATQLLLRGFSNVRVVPESAKSAKLLVKQCGAEGWSLDVLGTQDELHKLDLDKHSGSADVVLFMDSSFGRFGAPGRRRVVIAQVAQLLGKDGVVVFDLSNPIERLRNLQLVGRWLEDEHGYTLTRESIDPFTWEYRTTVVHIDKKDAKIKETCETGLLLPLATLKDELAAAGLTIKRIFGGYEQDPLEAESTRMIVVASR